MSKFTEEDIKLRYITPAIQQAGWDKTQFRMEYFFTDGQVLVRGKVVRRGSRKKADYILMSNNGNIPIAIIEAKDNEHSVGAGMQQAIEYAQILDVPFAYSSNGDAFLEHDFFTGQERELQLNEFPTEEELWKRYLIGKNLDKRQEVVVTEPFYLDTFNPRIPRYYQRVAIQKTIEAISKGQKRILIVMATGTGKTLTAFQIIHKLWKTRTVKKVLYLADRNILIDQTMQQDFKPFDKIMTKIQDKKPDSAYEIYMSLYHQLAGDDGDEPFREFEPSFFDLIIVDEAHRGSAKEESNWRKILEYFDSSIQIGMTATPKETKYVSNINYFGDPVYTYSLKQGIDDGFLAPYKVVRVGLDKDLEGWRPYMGQKDIYGNPVPDEEYNSKDYDKKLIIDERTQAVAKRITKWLHDNGRFSKTIVFCVDIDHAERMRQALINENTDLVAQNPKYIMRITGDNPEGKAQLDYFIDVNEQYPTIVTTSKLMTTGVDAKTTKLIVLDSNINSLTEFKQIIGRGTRLVPDFDKYYFTIMDFRSATRLFADPTFDGNPIPDEGFIEGRGAGTDENDPEDEGVSVPPRVDPVDPTKQHKIRVRGVSVTILNERVQYLDQNGKLISESIKDFTKRNILNEFATLDDFIHMWTSTEKKAAIKEELLEHGVLLDALREESQKDIDDFDLILHVAFDKKPLTKRERVDQVKKKGYLNKYSETCRDVLSALLDKYMDGGIQDLEDTRILENAPFDRIGSARKIAKLFGGKEAYLGAVKELQNMIYETRA
jgi:type I restriction enzyme R subunit